MHTESSYNSDSIPNNIAMEPALGQKASVEPQVAVVELVSASVDSPLEAEQSVAGTASDESLLSLYQELVPLTWDVALRKEEHYERTEADMLEARDVFDFLKNRLDGGLPGTSAREIEHFTSVQDVGYGAEIYVSQDGEKMARGNLEFFTIDTLELDPLEPKSKLSSQDKKKILCGNRRDHRTTCRGLAHPIPFKQYHSNRDCPARVLSFRRNNKKKIEFRGPREQCKLLSSMLYPKTSIAVATQTKRATSPSLFVNDDCLETVLTKQKDQPTKQRGTNVNGVSGKENQKPEIKSEHLN